MKLQKQKAFKYKGKTHYKYVLVLPENTVSQLGWLEGQNLKQEVKENQLTINPDGQSRIQAEEALYDEFKSAVRTLLKRFPEGLQWGEIREKLNFLQKRPNNKWVRQLEKDIDLSRVKIGATMIWKIENKTIFTTGYEGLSLQAFVDDLLKNNIEQLIDVREIALSRKNGFSKGALREKMKEVGIRYQHFSSLGSPKSLRHQLRSDWDYNTFFHEYSEHLHDADVLENLMDLEGLSKVRRTALMCFEREHGKCHRKIIADFLKKRGWRIVELREGGTVERTIASFSESEPRHQQKI